jgi:hypothetical protein
MMPVSKISVLKSIVAGTLVGLFGPLVVFIVLLLRDGFLQLEDACSWFLVWGLPAFLFALIGGVVARFTSTNSVAPHLSVALFPVLGGCLVTILWRLRDGYADLMLLWAYAGNAWLAGWWAIRTMRKEMPRHLPERSTITANLEEAARARFQSSAPKTEAVRVAPREVAEPHDNP